MVLCLHRCSVGADTHIQTDDQESTMGIRQDFLIRMLEELADAFERIFKDSGNVEDKDRALFEIEGILAEVFRTRRELLFMRPEEMIEDFDPRLAAEVGRLFLKHSELCEAKGQEHAAQRSFELGIKCLRGGLGQEISHADGGSNELMREMLRSRKTATVMSADEMADTWRNIFEIEARRQHYPEAEDALFCAVDMASDPSDHVARGVRFFEALQKLPDELLEERGFPRQDVDEALEDLREEQ